MAASSSLATTALSSVTDRRTRRASATSRCSLARPSRLKVSRMSSMPASAITSASPSFWQVMPTAPSSTCRRANSGILWVLMCGRSLQPVRVGIVLRAAQVGLDPVEVDQHRGRVEIVDRPGHAAAPPHCAPTSRHAVPARPAWQAASCRGCGSPARMRVEKSGASMPAARAASLTRERRRSSGNGSDWSSRPRS